MPSNTQGPRVRSTAALPLVLGLAAGVFVGAAGYWLFLTAEHRPEIVSASVAAAPARTVKVLPAVAGRITDLKVRLGERVTKDQELLIIDSGDLAQAYSDRDKARAQLILARK